MPIVQYVHGIHRCGIIVFYVVEVFPVPYCYQSIRLIYIGVVAGITFRLVYSTGVGVLGFL